MSTMAVQVNKRLRARTPVHAVTKPVRSISLSRETWPSLWRELDIALHRNGYTAVTIRFYRQILRAFSRHVGKAPCEVGPADLHAYLGTLPRDRCSWHWTAMNLSVLRTIFDKLGGLRALTQVRGPRRKRPLPEYLGREQVGRMLDVAENPRDRMLVGLIYGCGLKTGEIRKLRWSDVDLQAGTIRVPSRWGRADRNLPIPARMMESLRGHKERQAHDAIVFASSHKAAAITGRRIQVIIRSLAERAGIRETVLPVTLRNSYAVHFLEDGGTIRQLQLNIDHQFMASTARYLDLLPKVSNLPQPAGPDKWLDLLTRPFRMSIPGVRLFESTA